jgi:hypothetical protein
MWRSRMVQRLQRHPGHVDKLLLPAADPTFVPYVQVVVEVSATNQPEQLVDVVGGDIDIARHPGNSLEYIVVAGPPMAQSDRPEDILYVHVGFGEVLGDGIYVREDKSRRRSTVIRIARL